MQTPVAAAAERPSVSGYLARMSAALAALLGRAAGAELSEDELLLWLRVKGQITYPLSPLRVQEMTPPQRLTVRLSWELAKMLAGPYLPSTGLVSTPFNST